MLLGKALIPEDKGLGLEHGVDWGETPPEAFVEMRVWRPQGSPLGNLVVRSSPHARSCGETERAAGVSRRLN
jgi:hypothetical protein